MGLAAAFGQVGAAYRTLEQGVTGEHGVLVVVGRLQDEGHRPVVEARCVI